MNLGTKIQIFKKIIQHCFSINSKYIVSYYNNKLLFSFNKSGNLLQTTSNKLKFKIYVFI